MKIDKLDGWRKWLAAHEENWMETVRGIERAMPGVVFFSPFLFGILLNLFAASGGRQALRSTGGKCLFIGLFIGFFVSFSAWGWAPVYWNLREPFDKRLSAFHRNPFRALRGTSWKTGILLAITAYLSFDRTTHHLFLWAYLMVVLPLLSYWAVLLLEWFSLTLEARKAKLNHPPPPNFSELFKPEK